MQTVLAIDDEITMLNIMGKALTKFGYNVETASNGEEGIEKFNGGQYDLVITDMCMPHADGNDVIKHIRSSKKKSVPIIGISATPWLFKGHNIDEILTKPFPLKTLVSTVKNLVGDELTFNGSKARV